MSNLVKVLKFRILIDGKNRFRSSLKRLETLQILLMIQVVVFWGSKSLETEQ